MLMTSFIKTQKNYFFCFAGYSIYYFIFFKNFVLLLLLSQYTMRNSVFCAQNSSELESFKCIIVGNSDVGKTSLLGRYKNDKFNFKTMFTVGVDYASEVICKERNEVIGETTFKEIDTFKLSFWDCAGQDRYFGVVKSFFKGAHAAILVFDVSNKTTLAGLEKWYDVIKKETSEDILFLLAGNKCDKRESGFGENFTTPEEIGKFCLAHSKVQYIECSALSGKNCAEIFNKIKDCLYTKFYNIRPKPLAPRNTIVLKLQDAQKETKKNCCQRTLTAVILLKKSRLFWFHTFQLIAIINILYCYLSKFTHDSVHQLEFQSINDSTCFLNNIFNYASEFD